MRRHWVEEWKWGIWASIALSLLCLYPQLLMWGVRGREWNGAYAQVHGDEWLYSAYVQALIDGRPRRNDPYTGRDDQPAHPQPESVFSIQFVPAYLIAVPARLLRISASTAFIVLGVIAPFLSCLAIFWLLTNLIEDRRLAAAGAMIVICLGGLVAGQGAIKLLHPGLQYLFFPFLRRYEPSAMFPLFFLFCGFVWKSLNADGRTSIAWAVGAGLALDLLIFSYLYLWTSAISWLACLALFRAVANSSSFRKDLRSFLTILFFAICGLAPYLILLAARSRTLDNGQKLILSRAPDLFRIPELLGLGVIAFLVLCVRRKKIDWRQSPAQAAVSFSLMSFVVFNQQLITGRSLQPYHFELFLVNYATLVGAVVAVLTAWRSENETKPVRNRAVLRAIIIALWWGIIEVVAPTNVITRESQFIDRVAAVGQRLRHLSNSEGIIPDRDSESDPRRIVLAMDFEVSVILPTFAPQAVLWAPNFDFLNLEPGEGRERFYKYLYYSGFDENELAKELGRSLSTLAAAAFGHERVIPDLAILARPITAEEIATKSKEYQAYTASFTRARAAQHVLSYVIVGADGRSNLSNLDRWYQRDEGERVGDYVLYRVKLRP